MTDSWSTQPPAPESSPSSPTDQPATQPDPPATPAPSSSASSDQPATPASADAPAAASSATPASAAPAPASSDAPAVSPLEPAPTASESAPASSDIDVAAEIEKLRQQMADLEQAQRDQSKAVTVGDQQLSDRIDQLRKDYEEWPQKGDQYADSPQPWDLREHGLPQPGVTRDHLPGGEPDPISPVVVAHNKPLLTAGMAGDAVAELASLLQKVGYSTSVSEGRNHTNAFDDTISAAVSAFKRDYHVLEDPSQFRDSQEAERFVGPWVWEALIRAAALVDKAA